MATEVAIKLTAMVDTFNQAFLEASKKVTGLGKDVDQMAAKLGRASKNMQKAGETMSLYVTAPIVAGLGLMAREYANQEVAQEKLNASLRSTGQYSEETAKKLNDLASAIQKETTVGDDASLSLMQLGIQSGISADKIGEATQAAIGLSKAYGIEMEQAIRGVALAQNGDYALLQKRIPQLKAAGTASEKYAEYQKAIANGYKIAQAEGNTFYGSSIKLKNAVGDLMEVGGQVVAEWITPMIKKLMELIEWLQGADDGTKKWAVGLAVAAAAIGPLLIIMAKAIALYRAWLIVSTAVKAGLAGQAVATSASTAAFVANKVALIAATAAQKAYNLAVKANPLMIVAGAFIAVHVAMQKAQSDYNETQEEYQNVVNLSKSAVEQLKDAELARARALSSDKLLEYHNIMRMAKDVWYKSQQQGVDASTKKWAEEQYAEAMKMYQEAKQNQIKLNEEYNKRTKVAYNAAYGEKETPKASDDEWLNKRKAAREKWLQYIEEANKSEAEMEIMRFQEEKQALDEDLKSGFVTRKEHQQAEAALTEEHTKKLAEIVDRNSKKAAEARNNAWSKSLEVDQDIVGKFAAIQTAAQEGTISGWEQTAMKVAAVMTTAFSAITNVMNTLFDAQRQQVERKYEHLTAEEEAWQEYQDAKEQQEYNRMSVRQRREADLKKASDEAEAARERKKQKELAKIARQQAIMQRAIAMFQIPVNTAMAIMQIWSNAMNSSPYEAAKIGLTAMVSGLAAAQMAATMAAPLPQAAAGAYAAGNSVVNIGEKNGELVYPLYGAEGTKALDYFAERLMGKLNQKIAGSSSFSLSPAESESGSNTSVQIKPVDLNIFADKFGELLLQITTSRQGLVHKGALVG